MNFGICIQSVVPVRTNPDDTAEMCTQILFGELLKVLQIKKTWCKIRITNDNYEGWIDEKQYLSLEEEEYKKLYKTKLSISLEVVHNIFSHKENSQFPIVLGSTLPNIQEQSFNFKKSRYSFSGHIRTIKNLQSKALRDNIIKNSLLYLNAPYLWGGRSPFGIDCSGLTQMVYKLSGIQLLRDASQQATQGETLNFISDSLPADVAFFDNDEGNIIHVGILLEDDKIIHASGKVRIDRIDHEGIFNIDKGLYTHTLRLIKRFI